MDILAEQGAKRSVTTIRRYHTTLYEHSEAIYSQDEMHRLWLSRKWNEGPLLAFIGLNPSTATERENDPTVSRCVKRARREGFAGMIMLNVFSIRHPDPKTIKQVAEPNHSLNNDAIEAGSEFAHTICCCWGVHARYQGRHEEMQDLLKPFAHKVRVLKLTKRGYPGHPLYLPNALELREWSMS